MNRFVKAAIFGIVTGISVSAAFNAWGSDDQIECLAKNM